MKIMIFSDSHGNSRAMDALVSSRHDVDVFLHLGDGVAEFEATGERDEKRRPFVSVRGNNDFSRSALPETVLELEGKRLFLTHGWQHPLSSLTYRAMERNADVLLFGHTHCRYQSFVRDDVSGKELHLFNPGSISLPRDGRAPSFGILEIKGGQMLFSHGDAERRLLG